MSIRLHKCLRLLRQSRNPKREPRVYNTVVLGVVVVRQM